MMSKPIVILFSSAVLFAVLWPVQENWEKDPKDSFPLSYFPMFSQKRDRTQTVNYFVAYDGAGKRYLIPYQMAGSGGFNQVRRQINKKIRTGKGDKITQKLAKKIAGYKTEPYQYLVRLELVKGEYNPDTYFLKGDKRPIQEQIISTQTIERP